MTVGSKKISCMGIVGDGCGGGREFSVENETLSAFDPQTQESISLLHDIYEAESISKSGCIVTIQCKEQKINFDLSLLKKV